MSVERRGPNVEFRASVVSLADMTVVNGVPQPKVDVVALPAVFQAHPVEKHVRPAPLVSIPLADAKRMAKQILGMGD